MSDPKAPTAKYLACWFAWPLLLLTTALPVQAFDYVFPGALPVGCLDNGGANYSCAALTLAAGDTFTIASPKPATITFSGALSTGAGVLINDGGVTTDLKVVINGAFTLGAVSNMKATVQTLGAGAVTVSAGSTVTGSVTTETGDVTVGALGRIGGAIKTITGSAIIGANASVGGAISTVTGYVTVGASAVIDGAVSTLNSGYVVLGASAKVGGAIKVSGAGYVTLGDSAAVNGAISTVSDAITVGANAQVNGSLTVSQTGAVTLGDSAKVSGDISTETGATTVGANAQVSGQIFMNVTGAITIGANGKVHAVCCYRRDASCVTDGSGLLPVPLVCLSGLDHYELTVPAASISCLPTTVTVTACANGSNPCSSVSTSVTATVNLASSAGTITSAMLSNGVGTATLSHPLATDGVLVAVSLLSATTPTNNAANCTNGSCSTRFNTAGFIFSATAAGAVANLPAQVAGVNSGRYYLRAVKTGTSTAACVSALTGANTVNWAHQCNDPTSCVSSNLMRIDAGTATVIARNDAASVSSYSPVAMTFDANGSAPFSFDYGDVGRVTLWASKTVNSAPLLGRSNAFVVRPHHFALSNIEQTATPNTPNPAADDTLGPKFIKAGEPFSVTVTAMSAHNSATPNYGHETAPESVKLASQLLPGVGLSNNPALSGSFGTFNQGVATSSAAYRWNDVGIIALLPSIADQDYLGAGDTIGEISGKVGRFYAAQFTLSAGAIANRTDISGHEVSGCGAFTYMGERMNVALTLTAQTVDGTTALNYSAANGFAKLDPETFGNPLGFGAVDSAAIKTPLTSRLDTSLTATGRFAGGLAAISTPLVVSRGTSPSGPYEQLDIGVAPQDSDGARMAYYDLNTTGVSSANSDHTKVARTGVRFGRLHLLNAYGSEALALPVPLTAQYWKREGYYVTNADDSCTVLPIASITMGNYLKQLNACETQLSPTGNVALVNGQLPAPGLVLSKPGVANVGSVDLRINLSASPLGRTCTSATESAASAANMPWLGLDPTARATFGIYKSRLIYLRENY